MKTPKKTRKDPGKNNKPKDVEQAGKPDNPATPETPETPTETSTPPGESYQVWDYTLHFDAWEYGIIGSGKPLEYAVAANQGAWSFGAHWDSEIFLYIRVLSDESGAEIRRQVVQVGGATNTHNDLVNPAYRIDLDFEFDDFRTALRNKIANLPNATDRGINNPGNVSTAVRNWTYRYVHAPRRANADRHNTPQPVVLAEGHTEPLRFEIISAWMVLLPVQPQQPNKSLWENIKQNAAAELSKQAVSTALNTIFSGAPQGSILAQAKTAIDNAIKKAVDLAFAQANLPATASPKIIMLDNSRTAAHDPTRSIPEVNARHVTQQSNLRREPFTDLEPPYAWDNWDVNSPGHTVLQNKAWEDSMTAAANAIRDARRIDIAEAKRFWHADDRQLWLTFVEEYLPIAYQRLYMIAYVSLASNIKIRVTESVRTLRGE